MIKHFQPQAVPNSGAPFSQVVIDDHYVHLAGLVAADFPAGMKTLGDVGEETNAILNVIKQILDEMDMSMNQIVRTDVHLSDLDDFDAMDAAYRQHFRDNQFPARTTIESPHLFAGSKVEITCMVQKNPD